MGLQHSQIQQYSNPSKKNNDQQNHRFQFKHLRPQLLSQHDKSYNRKSVGKIRTKQLNNRIKNKTLSPIHNYEQVVNRQGHTHKQKLKQKSNPTLSIQINEEENEYSEEQVQQTKHKQTPQAPQNSQSQKIAGLVRFSKFRFQDCRKVSLANSSIVYIETAFFDSSTRTLAQIIQNRLYSQSDQQYSKIHKIFPQKDIQNMILSLSTTLSLLQEAGIHYSGFNFKSKSNFRQIFNWMQKIVIFKDGTIKLIPNQLLLLKIRNNKESFMKYQPIGQTFEGQFMPENNLRKLGLLILRVCYLTLTGAIIQQDSEISQNKQIYIESQLKRVSQYYDQEFIKILRKMIFSKCKTKQFKNWLQQNKTYRQEKQERNRNISKRQRSTSNSRLTNKSANKIYTQEKKQTQNVKPQVCKQKTIQFPKSIQKFKQYSPRKCTEETQRYYALRQRISKSPFNNYQRKKNRASGQQPKEEIPQRIKLTKRAKCQSKINQKGRSQLTNCQAIVQKKMRNKQRRTNQVYFKKQHLLSEKSEGSKSPKRNTNPKYTYLDKQTEMYLKTVQNRNNCSKKNPDSNRESQRLRRIQYNLDNRINLNNQLFKNNRLYENCEKGINFRDQKQCTRKDRIKYDYDFKMLNQENQEEHQYRLKKQHLYNRPTEEVYNKKRIYQQNKNRRLQQRQQIKNRTPELISTQQLTKQKSHKLLKVQQSDYNDFSQRSYQKHQVEIPDTYSKSNHAHHSQGINHEKLSKIDKQTSQHVHRFYQQQSYTQNFERDYSPNFKDKNYSQKLHFHSQLVQQGTDREVSRPKNQPQMFLQKSFNNLNGETNSVSKIKAQIAKSKKLIEGIKKQRQTENKIARKERRQLKQNFIGF